MATLSQEDSQVIRINEERLQSDSGAISFYQSEEDDVKKDLQMGEGSSKRLVNKVDKFETMMVGKNLFEPADQNLLISNRGNQGKAKVDQNQSSNDQKVICPQTYVRVGRRSRLPQISGMKRAASIGLSNKEELTKISKNAKDMVEPTQPLWKKTKFKWSEISSFSEFIKSPVPRNKQFMGSLQRDREGMKRFFPLFTLYFTNQMKYIMSSKRMSCKSTSNFSLTSSLEELIEKEEFCLGVLQSNFLGTLYNLYDSENEERQILATIYYQNQLSFSSKPRHIEVYVVSPYYTYEQLSGVDSKKNLKELYEIEANSQNKRIIKLVNKKPKWNDKKSSWELNFRGKMQIPSVKNMILVDAQTEKQQALLLAKTGDHTFCLDVDHPLSPRVAMAIVNSSFDWKWVCQ